MPRILLVDDDTAVRLVFLEILFDAGYAAHSFAAGSAILESGHPFDLLTRTEGLPEEPGRRWPTRQPSAASRCWW